MQIATKSKTPKIISGIAATISLISFGFFLLPSFWFWVSFDIFSAALVAGGCIGEWWLHHHPAGRKKNEKDEHHKLESRFIAMVALGVIMELFALGNSIHEGVKLENRVSEANERAAITESNNLVLQTNVASLNGAVLQLAHQYDLSTNALAEANERLATIKPAKERLIDCLNAIDPGIIDRLKKVTILHVTGGIKKRLYNDLEALSEEDGSREYIKEFKPNTAIIADFMGEVALTDFELLHSLLE